MKRRDQCIASVKLQAASNCTDGLRLAYLQFRRANVSAQNLDAGCRADVRDRSGVGVISGQSGVIELLRRGLGYVAVHRGIGGRLLCSVGLHDLTGHLFDFPKHRSCSPVLAIDDRKSSAFDRSDDYRGELGPVEMVSYLDDIGCAASTDLALIFGIDHKTFNLDPLQDWSWSGSEVQRPAH